MNDISTEAQEVTRWCDVCFVVGIIWHDFCIIATSFSNRLHNQTLHYLQHFEYRCERKCVH